ncbi:protein of unknown function [Pseudomonas marincola]|uniref:Uncharacterized protein n=1 Tax=Pseudomonas marincola TaxID=437900 RepID=A0A8S2BEB8_9PSED|nr:protein of unknown function [Pseudomonas marincola]
MWDGCDECGRRNLLIYNVFWWVRMI